MLYRKVCTSFYPLLSPLPHPPRSFASLAKVNPFCSVLTRAPPEHKLQIACNQKRKEARQGSKPDCGTSSEGVHHLANSANIS